MSYGFQGQHSRNLALALSECPTWQALCGAATAPDALEYIRRYEVQPEPDPPYAVILPGDTSFSAVGAGNAFVVSGHVDVLICLAPDGDTPEARFDAFDAAIHSIVFEVQAIAMNGYAVIREVTASADSYGRVTDPERRGRGDIYAALLRVALGAQ